MIECEIRRADSGNWRRISDIRLRSLVDSPDAFGATLAQEEATPDNEWHARVDNDDVAHFLAMTKEGESIGVAVRAPCTDYEDNAGLFAILGCTRITRPASW